jgi:3-oxoacyl-[acyl-carrier-protein] synthase III
MINIERYGNTTAGTLPLGMMQALDEKRIRKGDLVLLIAVGAGYTTGAVLMRWAY